MTTATKPKERPILFSGEMVRAILEKRKTQTRGVIRPRFGKNPEVLNGGDIRTGIDYPFEQYGAGGVWLELKCPYGKPGDRLWLREAWARVPKTAYAHSDGVQQTIDPTDTDMAAVYKEGWERCRPGRWKPSIHMPRWASRITLEATGVRVERVQDISRADAKAEGFLPSTYTGLEVFDRKSFGNANLAFRACWDSLNKKRGYGWNESPWVWVVEFKRVEGDGDGD